jgi:hypothetical protein
VTQRSTSPTRGTRRSWQKEKAGLRRGRVKHTAYHEAGHAVIARVLTLAAGRATIELNFADGSAGYGITRDPYQCEWQWERRGKVRAQNAAWHARIMAYMAGAEAEVACLGRCHAGDGDDRYQIMLMMEEITSEPAELEARLRRMTQMLVLRHKARIVRVAKALLAETALSGKKLDQLVGRSVNDVKPNSPLLLAMHKSALPRRG